MSRWDDTSVDSYEAWFETPEGAFALTQERRLLEQLVSPWPRREATLVDIGCGPGIFMKMFWETGFDVSGLDSSPDMLGAARRRLGPQAAYHVGKAEHLPFEDNEFDFATLLTVLEFCEDPVAALREARRVAKYGVLVSFLNRHSLYNRSHGAPRSWKGGGKLIEARWFGCLEMRRLILDTLGPKRFQSASVLPGPYCTWRADKPWGVINRFILPLGLGAYGAFRADFIDEKPLTPLYSFSKSPA